MTREEETVKILEAYKNKLTNSVSNQLDKDIEAFDIAIKALETIPKYKDAYNRGWDDGAKASYEHLKMCEEEQSGDLISRQAVIDLFGKIDTYTVLLNSMACFCGNAKHLIEELPSVTVEQTVNAIPMSVIKDIKTDIRREYKKREYAGDAFEMGTAYGLNGALQIIDKHIGGDKE